MSAEKLITEHIDLWTSSVKAKKTQGRGSSKKHELYGIKKLRELILELAVRGKLVPQNQNDEPVSVLLERIAVEKKQLIKDKKIKKKPKLLPEITEGEKPFELPVGWEWVRFQNLSIYIQRGKGPKYAESGSVQVVSQKCVQWSGFDLEKARYVEESSIESYQEERFLQPRDLLWNSTGTGTVGRINIIDHVEVKKLVADSHLTVIRPLMMEASFLKAYVSAPGVQSRIEPDHESSLVSGSTKQVELNTSTVIALPIPVPSIVEQRRIVAKINELMALCDQLEQQTEASLEAHKLLVDTLLATLTDARDANELSDNWARLAEHFDTLITTDYAVEQLKQTILQLAVQGKLVPQDHNDEPASELLKRIAAEKEQLVKEKKIKKQKPLPKITEEEKPFEIPLGWEWVRFQNLSIYIQRGKGPKYAESGSVQVVSQKCVQWSGFDLEKARYVEESSLDSYQEERFLQARDLLWNSTGTGTVGRINILGHVDVKKLVADSHVTVIRPLMMEASFLQAYVSAPVVQSRIEPDHENALVSGSTKQVELNTSTVIGLPIPVPPIVEQHRIITKVDELIALCDRIKDELKDSQTTHLHLSDAIVDNALEV